MPQAAALPPALRSLEPASGLLLGRRMAVQLARAGGALLSRRIVGKAVLLVS